MTRDTWKATLCLTSTFALAAVSACVKSTTSPSANSSQITIGAPADSSGNGDPFGSAVPTYQQVYASASFGMAPVHITSLTFPHTNTTIGGGTNIITPATYTFSLSTTSKSVDALDTVNLPNNLGADNQTVFSGQLSTPSSGLVVNITTFTYTPTAGNLLLQIVQAGGTCCGGIFFDARNGTAGALFSRAGAGVGGLSALPIVGTSDYGLVTTFTIQ